VTLDELVRSRVVVWGLGAEGRSVVELLRRRGADPTVVDDSPAPPADALRAPGGSGLDPVVARPPGSVDWAGVDAVVRSPGVPHRHPDLAAAAARGVTITTAMAVWLEDAAALPVLAVTGTKGKSTTAALAAGLLEAEGLTVALAGNIGVPVTDLYGRPPCDAYVVEVSSYQAADVTTSPRVVVVTNLSPDHLDWHGGEDAYYRDKLRLVTAGPTPLLAVGSSSAEAVARTGDVPGRVLFGPSGTVRVGPPGSTVHVDGRPVVDAGRLGVPGEHNVWNLCGAVAGVSLLLGRPPSPPAAAAAVDGFGGLSSRCTPVGTVDGRDYVDDALASNPFATAASLRAFAGRPVTLVVGGGDRGVDPGPLVDALGAADPAAAVVVLEPLPMAWAPVVDPAGGRWTVRRAADMATAVAEARALTPRGGVVLFSPAAPTPAGQGGYRQRSEQFRRAALAGSGRAGPAEPAVPR
jgi:UDP-N-acetylmuramoylalanine--D-glutamate ligase